MILNEKIRSTKLTKSQSMHFSMMSINAVELRENVFKRQLIKNFET